MSRLLDVRGLACPLPVIETRKILSSMTTGMLEVIVDNEIPLQNLEKMATQLNLQYERGKVEEGEWRLRIFLADNDAEKGEAKTKTKRCGQGKIVLIPSEYMGTGDPVLGEILLKGFIYTLTELEEFPEKILLYNSGVKLAIKGSESVQDLIKLADAGVEILSCGTCLDFYQVTSDLQVGKVTNMYEIAQSTMEASLIIQP